MNIKKLVYVVSLIGSLSTIGAISAKEVQPAMKNSIIAFYTVMENNGFTTRLSPEYLKMYRALKDGQTDFDDMLYKMVIKEIATLTKELLLTAM